MFKRFTFIMLFLILLCNNMYAQIENLDEIQWQRVERDSLPAKIDSLLTEEYVPRLQHNKCKSLEHTFFSIFL